MQTQSPVHIGAHTSPGKGSPRKKNRRGKKKAGNGSPQNTAPVSPAKHKTSVVLLDSPAKFSKKQTDGPKFDETEEQAMVRRRCSSIAEAIAAADGEQQRRIEEEDINQRVGELHRKASVCMANRMEHEERMRRISLDEWAENNGKLYRIKQIKVAKQMIDQEQQDRVLEIEINDNVNAMHRKAAATAANRLEWREKARRMAEQTKCIEESRLIREESIKKAKELFAVARIEAMQERSLRTGEPMPMPTPPPPQRERPRSVVGRVVNFMKSSASFFMRQLGLIL